MSENFELQLMPAEAFEGAGGHLVILQEWPSIKGEHYVRVIIPMRDAEALAHQILAIARRANGSN